MQGHSITGYPEAMGTADGEEKSTNRTSTIVFVAAVALANLIDWLTDWPRSVFFVPAASISLAIVVYCWVKRRGRTRVRDGVQARS